MAKTTRSTVTPQQTSSAKRDFLIMSRMIKVSNPKRPCGFSIALVDSSDYERVVQYRWAVRYSRQKKIKYANAKINGIMVSLHRFIMRRNIDDGTIVDHINRNGLDCRRANLRLCTVSENLRNAGKTASKRTSVFKGVSLIKETGLWRATICKDYKQHRLGYYENEIDAARAYDEAAKKLFGEFARINGV